MSSKRWFVILFCAVVAAVGPFLLLNILADPFSVFGDVIYGWYSHGMTNNPKTAKFAYLDARVGEFDAFIIGPSGSSGFSTEVLERHTGLRWYNTFHFGANMEYTAILTEYLIKTHKPQQLLLCLPAVSAVSYSPRITDVSTEQPLKLFWRLPFLFADPDYAISKMRAYSDRSYVQSPQDVFIAHTGEYDKSRRDAEAIGAMDAYLIAYPEFVEPRFWNPGMLYIEETCAVVAGIAEMCRLNGIELIIAAPPMLVEEIGAYKVEQMQEFYSRITDISGFWNFISSSVSYEPRYFYDRSHFRNSIGEMMVARMFGDENIYIPDDFGVWVTKDNVYRVIADGFAVDAAPDPALYTKGLPVLMYHHLTEEGGASPAISIRRFEEHVRALHEAGYSAVSLEQVRDYVILGHELPERPVLLTFDDGYMSNYEHAFPILQRYGSNAAFFVIGVSFGKDTYKDTDEPITPHFGPGEALEMVRSGLISIQSHSYDLHHVEKYDYPFRIGVLRMEDESEQDYIAVIRNDHALMRDLLGDTGELFAITYPYGKVDTFSSILFSELGFQVTFSIRPGFNTLIKGLPQSLLELRRFNMTDAITGERLVEMLAGDTRSDG